MRIGTAFLVGSPVLGLTAVVFAVLLGLEHRGLRARLATSSNALSELELRASNHEAAPDEPEPPQFEIGAERSVSSVLALFERLAERAGVRFDEILAPESATRGAQGYELRGCASLPEICDFVSRVEREHRLLLLRGLELTPIDEASVQFRLLLASYHAVEDR